MMKSVADFKREAIPGSVWQCTHHWRPAASGLRTIIGGKTVLSYSFDTADGRTGQNGRVEFPKARECRFDGDSITWLDENDPTGATPLFTWTLVRP